MKITDVLRLSLVPLLFFLAIPFGNAQDSQIPELQHRLQQRDQVILELLERVEALEAELGVKPAKLKKPATPDKEKEVIKQAETVPVKTAPGQVVVDESMAERALERSLTRDGALLLPSGIFEIDPGLGYARHEDVTPSFVASGGGVIASETERNSDSLTASLLFRLGLPGDSQLEVSLPYRWRRIETVTNVGFSPTQTSAQSGNGQGDIRITLAKALLREDSGQPDVIGRLTWNSDSGDVSDEGVSLGGGFHELRGALSFIKRQDPVVFVGGLSYEYTFEEGSIQPGTTVAASFGSYIALNPQTSFNVLLSMAYQNETEVSGVQLDGSDRVIGSLFIGGSTLIARGTLLNISLGVGLTDDADDFTISFSLPMRFDSRIF